MSLTKFCYTCLFLMTVTATFGQHHKANRQIIVLRKAITGKSFVFGRWNKKNQTETHLTYLGKVKTVQGVTYKVVNSINYWGLSKRATSRILIFNKHNQYVGNYCVSMTDDLPQRMVNGQLIFINTFPDCDPKVITRVNLTPGLPKMFFRQCRKGEGDIYSFDIAD